jgi:hypothetical protein
MFDSTTKNANSSDFIDMAGDDAHDLFLMYDDGMERNNSHSHHIINERYWTQFPVNGNYEYNSARHRVSR